MVYYITTRGEDVEVSNPDLSVQLLQHVRDLLQKAEEEAR